MPASAYAASRSRCASGGRGGTSPARAPLAPARAPGRDRPRARLDHRVDRVAPAEPAEELRVDRAPWRTRRRRGRQSERLVLRARDDEEATRELLLRRVRTPPRRWPRRRAGGSREGAVRDLGREPQHRRAQGGEDDRHGRGGGRASLKPPAPRSPASTGRGTRPSPAPGQGPLERDPVPLLHDHVRRGAEPEHEAAAAQLGERRGRLREQRRAAREHVDDPVASRRRSRVPARRRRAA